MSNRFLRFGRWGLGGVLAVSGVLQFFGLPSDAPSWFSFVTDHQSLILSICLVALGLLVIIDPRKWIERYSTATRAIVEESDTDAQRGEMIDLQSHIAELTSDRDRERGWRQKEASAAAGFHQEVVELQQRLRVLEEDSLAHLTSRLSLQEEIRALKPRADWADELVNSARGRLPFLLKPRSAWLTHLENLNKDEPWFTLCVPFHYCGVHRLLIGEQVDGLMARFSGDKFNLPPITTIDPDVKPPFDRVGPTGGIIRFEQRVSPASAASLKTVLRFGDPDALGQDLLLTLRTMDLFVSVRLVSYANEELWKGRLLGEDIEARYRVPQQ